MKQKLLLGLVFIVLSTLQSYGQDKSNVKFGNVTEKDFAPKLYSIDSNANAVVIADIGSSQLEGNSKGFFSLVYKHYKRVHVLNKNGYDIADVSIPLYSEGEYEEELDKLKAVTYNLENGKIVETKLDVKNNVFKDKISKNRVVKKFTFPNVKEGSIIEFEYTIHSDYLTNLQPWEFQGAYPRLWSEYNLTIPEFMGYVFITQGYKRYDINKKESRNESFRISDNRGAGASDNYNFTANVTDYRWVIKEVPALKEESFTSTVNNHISKIEFELSEFKYPLTYRSIMGSWPKTAKELMEADYFGLQVSKDNGWLKDDIAPVIMGATTKMEKAQKIYAYVRDNFTCTRYTRWTMDQTLRNVAKTKNGNDAEINLLLTAMLKYAGIDASPVILSTRDNGFTYSALYAIMSKFNYTICEATIDGKKIYLDATHPRLGFGFLPVQCYNGAARVINDNGDAVEFNSEAITEKKFTSIFIINDEKGNSVGSFQQTPGYYESYATRNKIKDKGKEQLQKDIAKGFGAEINITAFTIDSLDKLENELGIKYEFDIVSEKDDILYINPMFSEATKENPFKSAERFYPVEMPYALDETYTLQLEIPAGYVVDELPKSVIVKLNEQDDGLFEYRISQSGDNISFRSRIKISRTYFVPEEYEMLREFFNLIVKKHAEQIVFKKKK